MLNLNYLYAEICAVLSLCYFPPLHVSKQGDFCSMCRVNRSLPLCLLSLKNKFHPTVNTSVEIRPEGNLLSS